MIAMALLFAAQAAAPGAPGAPGAPAPPERPQVSLTSLLAELTDAAVLARWPALPYRARQASSFDRAAKARGEPGWFAGADDTGFVRREQQGERVEWVLMAHDGPGCITRLWAPDLAREGADPRGPVVRIYLDGATEPILEERWIDLLLGRGSIPAPFAGPTARAGSVCLPIPYGKSCKVTTDAPPFTYQIGYRAYAPDARVESVTPAGYAAAAEVLRAAAHELELRHAPGEPSQGPLRATLRPGAELTVELPQGQYCVREFAVRLADAASRPEQLRKTVLVLRFDGQETVWVPLGDFFCSADELHPFDTRERSVSADGTLTCRWVMPYAARGELVLLNLGSEPVPAEIAVWSAPWRWDERSLLFHARWKPDEIVPGRPPRDWNLVEIEGLGVYVGDALTVLNPEPGRWWAEGDEKIWIDATRAAGFPQHFGTGTADYYGWAGGATATRADEFALPFLANVRVGGLDGTTQGFNICTRSRALDALPFDTRLLFDLETSGGSDAANELGYSAVTFFYARPGAKHNRPAAPDAARQGVLRLAEDEKLGKRIAR